MCVTNREKHTKQERSLKKVVQSALNQDQTYISSFIWTKSHYTLQELLNMSF